MTTGESVEQTRTLEQPESQAEKPGQGPLLEQRFTGSFLFSYRGNSFDANYATRDDLNRILHEIHTAAEGKEKEVADELGAESRSGMIAAKEIEQRASSAIQETNLGMQESQIIDNFFTSLMKENSLLSGWANKGLAKLDSQAANFVAERYKPTINTAAAHDAFTTRPQYAMDKDCFILSTEKAAELQTVLTNLNSDRFYIVSNFDQGDGFIANFNGVEVVFLSPPPEPENPAATESVVSAKSN